MYLEVLDDNVDEVCQECGEGDNEDVLMYCDGCGKLWHTYCAGEEEVPYASWFCDACNRGRVHGTPAHHSSRRGRAQGGRRRTRGMERRRRNHRTHQDDGWNQVWQQVWSQLNIDLDFPFEDDEAPATAMRRHRHFVELQRREHEAYEARMRVAELNGAAGSFRQVGQTLLNQENSRRLRGTTQPRETEEEVAAWDAFAAARSEEVAEPSGLSRKKRKSRTSSPAPTQPEGRLSPPANKRKRTSPSIEGTPSTRIRPSNLPTTSPRPRSQQQSQVQATLSHTAPSFLQSLLQEVEDSAGISAVAHRPSPYHARSPASEQHSPRPSSPVTSNHSSPRAMSATPPPIPPVRAGSPGLTSSIQPVYPVISYSPQRSASPDLVGPTLATAQRTVTVGIARPQPRRARVPATALATANQDRSRSHNPSPVRSQVTANSKADVQKLVSSALKPHYHEGKLDADQYTIINRDISRMLYDKIGNFDALDLEGRARWEKIAGEEVNKAVTALAT